MNQSLKTNMNYLSMVLDCHANVETLEKAMSELGIKQPEPTQELAVIYQMALDVGVCDNGQHIAGKIRRLVEQRAIPILNAQAD